MNIRFHLFRIYIFVLFCLFLAIGYWAKVSKSPNFSDALSALCTIRECETYAKKDTITIGITICGKVMEEALVLVKSLVIFSRNQDLDLRIFQHEVNLSYLKEELQLLQDAHFRQNGLLSYKIYSVWFPDAEWSTVGGICSSQRLFYSKVLSEVEKIIHLDSDVLFLSDPRSLWNHFSLINESQIAAMAPEGMPPAKGLSASSKVPFYGPRGLQAGVILMNLERMRHMDFTNEMRLTYEGYKSRLRYGDNDLLDIYFHFHPQYISVLPCEFNYGFQHCHCRFDKPGTCACRHAELLGISVLHGNEDKFHTEEIPFFRNIYEAFRKHDISNDTPLDLLTAVKRGHQTARNAVCAQLNQTVLSKFEKYISEVNLNQVELS